ncbi:MAG: A/G-specific adenine glycosylase [Flavobacteriaceae bacterium]|jgi:A/G-specific adenine glycosylase|nr:A/G-specific adenine glycosylase [Flavobacteriaceae bacterium]MBT6704923.1 A/G-specific adenine glycosylase [Flavobacteriaceae bacterium]|tara:strand:+ start:54 stop:1142 length:1089 start_codon:yes stop_codon:yes gene_type:complete
MPKSSSYFSKKLILWYLAHKRDLPWRTTAIPYYIWLSEIILQQTRVEQGLPYYKAFVSKYPTVNKLANAAEQEVLKLWQGLGYYSRARNLHATAKYVSNELNGVFPTSYRELIKLKGVGDYTASAIASICFNEATAVVDGNVYRALARYFGIATPINSSLGIKEFKNLAQQLIDVDKPGNHNQALMEFGARQCKPQNPNCDVCIFNDSCVALQQKKISELPVKLKKTKVKNIYFNYIVLISENKNTFLQKRIGKGIWQNLYEFPLIETEKDIEIEELNSLRVFQDVSKKFEINSLILYNEVPILHKLSHRNIYTRFWIAETSKNNYKAISISQIETYPVPKLIGNFITTFFKLKESGQKQKK